MCSQRKCQSREGYKGDEELTPLRTGLSLFTENTTLGFSEMGLERLKTFLFDTHITPLSKEGCTAQATVSKPVPESLFQNLSVSLSFGTVSTEGMAISSEQS